MKNLSIQNKEDIDKILEALDGHFMLKTNVIYERYILYTADQLSKESAYENSQRRVNLATLQTR